MKIKEIGHRFSICKVRDFSLVNLDDDYCFVGKTDEEKSLVCITENVPGEVLERQDGFRAFRIEGVLDFSLIGILSKLSTLLAENGIGIFALSTYNTDYILIREERFKEALDVLSEAGYQIR